jgi:hypothetical protein
MSSFDNPFGRQRGADHPEQVEAIKLWTRQTLALTEDTVLSISQFGCARPTCPRNMTYILLMSEVAPTRKISIHKSIVDICESDVRDACSDPRNAPS